MISEGGTGHLSGLEAESIFIMREAAAEFRNPVMLRSVGKDSSAMLHLARKPFFPSPSPLVLNGWWRHRDEAPTAAC